MSDTTIQDPVRQPLIDLLPLVRTLWKRRLLIVLATLGFIAVMAATINAVSGFLITDRMLKMFRRKGEQ